MYFFTLILGYIFGVEFILLKDYFRKTSQSYRQPISVLSTVVQSMKYYFNRYLRDVFGWRDKRKKKRMNYSPTPESRTEDSWRFRHFL